MKQYVPLNKQSKKAQKAYHQKKRLMWSINPVTRKPQNSKAYHRKRTSRQFDDDAGGFFLPFFKIILPTVFSCVIIN